MRQPPRNIISDQLELEIRSRRVIAPSKVSTDYWYGSWVNNQVLTWEQIRELRKLKIEVASVETMLVYVTCGDMVVPNSLRPTPHRAIRCPVIGRRTDRVKVITPNGHGKFVWPDGYLTKPQLQGKMRNAR